MERRDQQIGYWRVVWRRFRQHRIAYVGFFFFVLLLFLVVAGPHMVPYQLDQVSLSERMHAPSLTHWLGTDELGGHLGAYHARRAGFARRRTDRRHQHVILGG
jgi:ABC-type antimicrobial peptide transport system permease subunit